MPRLQRLSVGLMSRRDHPGRLWAPALSGHPALEELELSSWPGLVGDAWHCHQLSSCPSLRSVHISCRRFSGGIISLLRELAACPVLRQLELFTGTGDPCQGLQVLARSRSLRILKLPGDGAPPLAVLVPLLAPGACELQQLEVRFEMPDELLEEAWGQGGTDRCAFDGFVTGAAEAGNPQGALWRLVIQAVERGLWLGQGELQVDSVYVDMDRVDNRVLAQCVAGGAGQGLQPEAKRQLECVVSGTTGGAGRGAVGCPLCVPAGRLQRHAALTHATNSKHPADGCVLDSVHGGCRQT